MDESLGKDRLTIEDVQTACEILFGSDPGEAVNLLDTVDINRLEETYRERALATHPDRAAMLGRTRAECEELFKNVSRSYQTIRLYLTWHGAARNGPQTALHDGDENNFRDLSTSRRDSYWKGDVPERALMFGQYLYYSGRISSGTLIDAVLWQWTQRPAFGRIAAMWGYLTPGQLAQLLTSRRLEEMIGESALRLRYLTPFRRNAILGLQRMIQKPIGSFFLEREIFSSSEVAGFLELADKHNLSVT